MARASLHKTLGETEPTAMEQKLVSNVTRRVEMWSKVAPLYPNNAKDMHKSVESRGTESVLNALVLTTFQAPAAKQALDNMWTEQITAEGPNKGSFEWLQFHNAPWEGDSQYYGAVMGAMAAGAGTQYPEKMELLRGYLVREREQQVLANRLMLVWASLKTPGLLTKEQRAAIVDEALSKQQEDGGWSLSGLVGDWKRRDKSDLEKKSDGYATGLVAYVAQQAGVSRSDKRIERGLSWLTHNQEASDGRWLAYSLNKQRDLTSDVGRFMADAATAYAVMALQAASTK